MWGHHEWVAAACLFDSKNVYDLLICIELALGNLELPIGSVKDLLEINHVQSGWSPLPIATTL